MSVVSVKTGLVALLVRVAFAEVQQSALAGTAAALDAGMVEADHVRAQARASQRAAPVAGVPRGGVVAVALSACCHTYAAWVADCVAGSRST